VRDRSGAVQITQDGPALTHPARALSILFAIGLSGLVVQVYVLTGRAPGISVWRGSGFEPVLLAAASTAIFLWALWRVTRWLIRTGRSAVPLAAVGALGSLAANLLLLRYSPTDMTEFVPDRTEYWTVRGVLAATALLFATLCCWAYGWRAIAAKVRPALANLALTLAAVLVTFVICEAVLRAILGVSFFAFDNLVARNTDLLRNQPANQYDPLLGWVLAENQGVGQGDGFLTGEHGVRMNGHTIVSVPHRGWVAVGDSFAAGSEVVNWDSWPAQLEAMLGEPVVNAATGGWASDQIVLRGESLIPVLEPKGLIVSFLLQDIDRSGYATYSGGNKPYFTVERGALVAHNSPVPRFVGHASEIGWLRNLLGWSHLVSLVMTTTDNYQWWAGSAYMRIDTDPVAVSCRLLERLKVRTDADHVGLYFVLQYGGDDIAKRTEEPYYGREVVECAERAGIHALDTWDPLRAIHKRAPEALEALYVMDRKHGQFGHMSAAGNGLIARLLADAIRTGGPD
jgi:hypothetical protein